MERVGYLQKPKYIMALIQDALDELQIKQSDTMSREFLSIEEDVRYYNMPTTQRRLDGVFAKDASGVRWVRIPRIQRVDFLEDSGESTATSDQNIIII